MHRWFGYYLKNRDCASEPYQIRQFEFYLCKSFRKVHCTEILIQLHKNLAIGEAGSTDLGEAGFGVTLGRRAPGRQEPEQGRGGIPIRTAAGRRPRRKKTFQARMLRDNNNSIQETPNTHMGSPPPCIREGRVGHPPSGSRVAPEERRSRRTPAGRGPRGSHGGNVWSSGFEGLSGIPGGRRDKKRGFKTANGLTAKAREDHCRKQIIKTL